MVMRLTNKFVIMVGRCNLWLFSPSRLWTNSDFERLKTSKKNRSISASIEGYIALKYEDENLRGNPEQSEFIDSTVTLPSAGMQVHCNLVRIQVSRMLVL